MTVTSFLDDPCWLRLVMSQKKDPKETIFQNWTLNWTPPKFNRFWSWTKLYFQSLQSPFILPTKESGNNLQLLPMLTYVDLYLSRFKFHNYKTASRLSFFSVQTQTHVSSLFQSYVFALNWWHISHCRSLNNNNNNNKSFQYIIWKKENILISIPRLITLSPFCLCFSQK